MHFFHLVWIFIICSIVGLIAETCVSFIIDGHWESRAGFVMGPLSPIYGAGAVLFTLFLNPIRNRPAPVLFATSALVGGLFEYAAGWFFESRFGIVAWSYIDQPLNFHGHTCIGIMLVWGAVGAAWTIAVLPHMANLVEKIPANVRVSLTALAFTLLVADAALTLAALDCWYLRTAGNPPTGVAQQFFATYFGDSFMQSRFETMSMWPVLASR